MVADNQPQVRWAVLFSAFKYVVIYIPHCDGRPTLYLSPVLRFCLQPHASETPTTLLPPLWSLVTYMMLTERHHIGDQLLRTQLGVPPAPAAAPAAPAAAPAAAAAAPAAAAADQAISRGSYTNVDGHRRSERIARGG